MHIAVVTRNMLAGGAERVIAQLLAGWTERGVKCSLILLEKADRFYDIPDSVTVREIGKQSDNALANKLKSYGAARAVLKELKPDVVLSMPEEIGIYVIGAMLGTGIPVVVSERNNPWVMPNKKETRALRRLLYPFADGLIFQTKQASDFFPESQRKKGIVLPNPLELTRLPEVYAGEREKTVVTGGRMEPQKNFPLLIEAFAKFYENHSDYRLVIYGDGSLRPQLEALAAKLLPEGAWSMPGRVNDLPVRISRGGIFALSSDYEGVPNVLIEAMAVGTPSVSTDCAPGGAASLIRSGENGLLVPVGDADGLAGALARMADEPGDAARMAAGGVKLREELDANVVCRRWLEYLTEKAK